MPNRILKDSICSSENIDMLSPFHETVFYRLIVNVDDYGRLDARPKLLASKLFPLKDIRVAQIEDALRALTSAELVTLYTVDGKPFLQMNTWDRHQTVRNKKSKYPGIEDADEVGTLESNCNQLNADECKCSRNPIQSNPNPNPNPNPKYARGRARVDTVSMFLDLSKHSETIKPIEDVVIRWMQYKNEKSRGKKDPYTEMGMKSLITQIEKHIQQYGAAAVADCIELSMSNNWQGIIWDKIKGSESSNRKNIDHDIDEYIRTLEEEEARNAEIRGGKGAEVP